MHTEREISKQRKRANNVLQGLRPSLELEQERGVMSSEILRGCISPLGLHERMSPVSAEGALNIQNFITNPRKHVTSDHLNQHKFTKIKLLPDNSHPTLEDETRE